VAPPISPKSLIPGGGERKEMIRKRTGEKEKAVREGEGREERGTGPKWAGCVRPLKYGCPGIVGRLRACYPSVFESIQNAYRISVHLFTVVLLSVC